MKFLIRGAASVLFFCTVASAQSDTRIIPANPAGKHVASGATEARQATADDALAMLSSNERGVIIELVLDSFQLNHTPEGVYVTAPGADRLAQPGEPDLPGRVALVGIPPQADVRLSAEASDKMVFNGLTVRQATGFQTGAQSELQGRAAARLVSRAWAEVERIDIVRGVRTAFIRLSPVQYDPERKTVEAARRLKVTVSFTQSAVGNRQSGIPDRFDPILEQTLVNGAMAKGWQQEPKVRQREIGKGRWAFGDRGFYGRSDVWCKVKTETTGVYRITAADLDKAGFSAKEIDPRTLKLYTLGLYAINESYPDTMVEVPVFVKGEEDGKFDKADYLVFYAAATSYWDSGYARWRENLFTDHRVFWLTWGGAPGRRMATVSGAGAGDPDAFALGYARVEQDALCPARSGLLWLWQKYFKQSGVPSVANRVEFRLPGRTRLISVSGRMYSANPERETYPHFARLYLNGVLLDSVVMIARSSAPPPTNFLLDSLPPVAADRPLGTADTITIEVYGDKEMTDYLDYLQVRYRQELRLSASRPFINFLIIGSGAVEFAIEDASADALLLDVTDMHSPVRIVDTEVSGRKRKVKASVSGTAEFACILTANLRTPISVERRDPGRLLGSDETADYYVIAPDEFYGAARMFARYREGNIAGLVGATARAVQLSDIYDDYTFGMEEPGAIQRFFADKRPVYGLLAGDATYDYRNRLGLTRLPGVPAYEMGFDIDPEVYGQTAKAFDAWYADFEGRAGAPDMILARITCRSAVELRRFLDKVKTYETQPLGMWAKRFLLLADDEWLGQPGERDPIGFQHISGCENIMLYTRGLLDPVKIYLTEYPYTGVNDKAGARTDLLAQLNKGALFWCFYGHGAGFQLCHEKALNIDGVPQVHNDGRNPLAFFGSCGVGRFDDTRYEAIAEELVRKGSGCIATFGASKATTPGSNELFARSLFGGLAQNDTLPIGPSFFPAWLTYTIYHMFGDPATMMRMPRPGPEPVVAPDTFFPGTSVHVSAQAPVEKGMYGITARELDWSRLYSSEVGAIRYTLPGYKLYDGLGAIESGRLDASFLVPMLDYPDTVIVPNGSYRRVPASGNVSILSWDGARGYASRKADIPLGPAAAQEDSAPPHVMFFADTRPLVFGDTVVVSRSFTLRGVISDPSGILLAAVPEHGIALYIGARTSGRIDLIPRFIYDKGSSTTGRFEHPIDLGKDMDSLTIVVSDNLRNRRVATAYVRTELSDALRIDSTLVYPNPVSGPAILSFTISRAALVTVKIYTISGRLIRRLPEQPSMLGYNQVHWDGRDEHGAVLANGVYLYKIEARASAAGRAPSSATLRDKFILQR